jgi:hypothetical protein
MNLDNPNLTAFALGELTPAEHAEMEQQARSDREIAAEIEETREIARILRTHLVAEPCGALAEHQRDAIFREARILDLERRALGQTSEPFIPLIVPRATWWNRPGPWQAIAACAVAGFAAYALLVNVGPHRGGPRFSEAGEIAVGIPTDGATQNAGIGEPDLISPGARASANHVATAGLNPAKALTGAPKIDVQPMVEIGAPPALAQGTPNPEADQPKPKGPRIVGNGDGKDWRAGADIGHRNPRTATLAEQNFAAVLKERKNEADSLHEGSAYEDFARVYQPSATKPGQYEMIRTPSLKVDAEFVNAEGKAVSGTIPPDARVKRLSQPYLE